MRRSKKTKIILGFGMSLVAIAPVLTLTSCGSFSQYYLPFITSGTDIFSDLKKDPNFLAKDHKDHDGQNIFENNYLPKSYIHDAHTGQGVEYLYAQPQNVNVDPWELYGEQWYTTSAKEMATAASGSTKVSYRNYNQLAFANATLSISNNLAHFYSNLLTFEGRYASNEKNHEIMDNLFGAFDHGDKNASGASADRKKQNKDFYEFTYGLSNTLGVGQSPVKFDVSAVDYRIKTWENGPGPFITQDNEEKFTFTRSDSIDKADAHIKYGDEKTATGDVKYRDIVGVEPIPFLISKSNLSFSYYNPLVENSFSTNEWCINDVKEANNEIKRTDAWKNFYSVTDAEPEVETLTWNVSSINSGEKFNAGAFPTGSDVDPTFASFAADICYSDFIVLANYSIKTILNKDEPDPTKLERVPVMSGISGIYPAYMLANDENAFIEKAQYENPKGKTYKFINSAHLNEKLQEMNKKLIDVEYEPKAGDLPIFKYLFSSNPEGDANATTSNFLKKII